MVNHGQWSSRLLLPQIKDGCVWGRGAIDDKQAVMGHLEAVEDLLASGYDDEERGIEGN